MMIGSRKLSLWELCINIKHRLVYSVDEGTKIIRVVSVWSHYE